MTNDKLILELAELTDAELELLIDGDARWSDVSVILSRIGKSRIERLKEAALLKFPFNDSTDAVMHGIGMGIYEWITTLEGIAEQAKAQLELNRTIDVENKKD